VIRGASFVRCLAAIDAAAVLDVKAREEREEAHERRRIQAHRAATTHPSRIAAADISKLV